MKSATAKTYATQTHKNREKMTSIAKLPLMSTNSAGFTKFKAAFDRKTER